MSWVASLLLNFHNWWNNTNSIRTSILTQKIANLESNNADFKPLRIGILGAADINFVAIIDPVSTHPSAIITAIAARDKSRAQAQIDAFKSLLPGAVKAHGSYDAVVSDPDIDAVYIPLPNGLHHKWALAALENGKHVLIEKPMTSNAREAREIRDAASRAGKVALEAFHWRFHPAAHTVKAIVLGGEYGPVRSVNPDMILPAGVLGPDDIRFHYSLGGGASMDLTYVYSAAAYFAARDIAEPNNTTQFQVLDAKPRLNKKDKLVDDAMRATLLFKEPSGSSSSSSSSGGLGLETETETKTTKAVTSADLYFPKLFGLVPRLWAGANDLTIHCEKAEILFTNFAGPWLNHAIVVTPVTRDSTTGKVTSRDKKKTTTHKCYKGGPVWERVKDDDGKVVGEDWWTTYRYQLEGFVRKIRETETETETGSQSGYRYKGPFVSLDESVRIMEIIDAVYEKAGLPIRGQ